MKPLKPEIEALRDVMFTPVEEFVTDKDAEKRDDEQLQALAYQRMFTRAIEAVDSARGSRTCYMIVLRHGTTSVTFTGFGPYATKNQAEKALEHAQRTFGPTGWAVVPTRNEQGYSELLEAIDAPPAERKIGKVEQKHMDAELRQCLDNERTHMRAGSWRGKGNTEVEYVGNVRDLRQEAGLA